MIVVIPTGRTVRFDYLKSLLAVGARFIVVDDTGGLVKGDHPQFRVFNWKGTRTDSGCA